MKYKIYNDDVVDWAKSYNKTKFHGLLCDPPYHLTSITKRFGKKDSAPAKYGSDGVFQRASKGFMGNEWDGGDIAFNPETWTLLGQHLYPGAFGMAFSASRNWHRLAVAIEDAGFIIHPTIFCWLQGQGFPKATRIDKKVGDENWSGHRYGLQALKPAVEPIIVFQKPYEGKPLDNITQTGAGALNIDATRIPLLSEDDEYVINTFDDGAKPFGNGAGHAYTSRKISKKEDKRLGGNGSWKTDKAAKNVYEGGYAGVDVKSSPDGRWPANFILDEETSQQLDQQTGTLISGLMKAGTHKQSTNYGVYSQYSPTDTAEDTYADRGGASRFFYTVSTRIDESDPVYYCSKASTTEKTAGLDERSNHPTHKPLDLCRYLASMLLPPDMYEKRTILIPFSGVGSEIIGAGLAGWDRAVGIEKDTENGYVDIAHKRLEYWLKEQE